MSAPTDLDAVFSALADPTRRAILEQLQAGDHVVTALTAQFALSQPAISKHLRVLEDAGLVSRRREGRTRPVHLEAAPLKEATDFLERYRAFWEARFEQLDVLVARLQFPSDDDEEGA